MSDQTNERSNDQANEQTRMTVYRVTESHCTYALRHPKRPHQIKLSIVFRVDIAGEQFYIIRENTFAQIGSSKLGHR